jgi:hypothetical protein
LERSVSLSLLSHLGGGGARHESGRIEPEKTGNTPNVPVRQMWATRGSGEAIEFGVARVLLDCTEDVEGHGKGATTVFEGDDRLRASSDGMEKASQFGMERLLLNDFRLGRDYVWHGERGAGQGRCFGGVVDSEDKDVFAGVVDRDVLVRLEESKLANPFGADTTCSEVGDAAGIEFHANVGDVDLVGENGESNGADFFDWRVDQGEDDVEIVNHEIEDNVDV